MYNPNKTSPGTNYPPGANARAITLGTTREREEMNKRLERKKKDIESGMNLDMVLHRFWHWPSDKE